MEILETMTFTKSVDGSTKVLGTYLYVEGSQMLRDRKKYLIKRGYLYDKATKRYEKHFKGGNITTITFTKKNNENMLALLRAEDRKRNVVGIKEIEFDNKKQRMMQAKSFGRNVGAFKVYINWATGIEIYTPSEHCFERINR